MAKAGSGFALPPYVEHSWPSANHTRPERPRVERPSRVVSVAEMSPSRRALTRTRGKVTARELEMRASRTRLRVQKRLGIKHRVRYTAARLALRAERRNAWKGK